MTAENSDRILWVGYLLLFAWGVLILAGIAAKRVYGLPDWVVFFHLPAAVCLVLAMRRLSHKNRLRYQSQLAREER